MMNIGEQLGLTSMLTRMINQRGRHDNNLILGLSILTLTIIILCYLYVKGYIL